MIKAILFDYDGTLSNRLKSAYLKYKDVATKIFTDLDPNGFELEGIVQRLMTWDEFGTINKRHVYEMLNKYYNLNLDVDYWVKQWYSDFHEFQVLHDNCIEVLNQLHTKYKIGCITNGPVATQRIKLEFTGLLPLFDCCLISKAVGIDKPDPAIFELAAKQLNLLPEEIAFVGDNFYADCVGALRVGMMPIWFFTDPKRECIDGVKRIYSLTELLELF